MEWKIKDDKGDKKYLGDILTILNNKHEERDKTRRNKETIEARIKLARRKRDSHKAIQE